MGEENKCSMAGLKAEDWVKMWDSGFTHDHSHVQDGPHDDPHVHDDTHFQSCGEGDSDHGHHHHGHGLTVDEFLKRHMDQFTGGDTAKSILVTLCGNSPDMEWLCDKGYTVVGVDISETAIKAAFEKAKGGPIPYEVNVINDGEVKVYSATDGKKLKVYVGDFFGNAISPELLGAFECIWDSHGIVSFPIVQQEDFAKKLVKFLKPGGKILFSVVDYDITKLEKGPAPAPVPFSKLQELFPQGKLQLLEDKPLPSFELAGVEHWSNPIVLITL